MAVSFVFLPRVDEVVVSERALVKDQWTVRYYVFRLTVESVQNTL